MKKANDFHAVLDCQQVFRKLLEAFANPGRLVDISAPAGKLDSPFGAYVAVAATLIDNETSFCVVGGGELAGLVRQFTYGMEETPDRSGFVFVLERCNAERIESLLAAVPAGTMEEPHRSGIVFVRVESFDAAPGCAIKGPGVDGTAEAPLSAYAALWLRARHELAREYPCGVDLAFMTDAGQVVAAPRLVQLAG